MSNNPPASEQFVEDVDGGSVIGEGGYVYLELDRLQLTLTPAEADQIAAAIAKVRGAMKQSGGGL